MRFFKAKRTVGCLGKLPFAADFNLEARIGGAAEESLSAWLQAIPKAGDACGIPAPAGAAGHGFLLLDAQGKGGISGRLWPSTDSAGRSFPFAAYIALDRRAAREDFRVLVLKLWSAWQALDSLARADGRYWAGCGGSGEVDAGVVHRAIGEARIAPGEAPFSDPADLARTARELELWPLLSGFFPGEPPARSAEALRHFAAFLRNLEGGDISPVALRAPFSTGHPAVAQLAFWTEWMETALRRPLPPPRALFLPWEASAAGGLWFLYRDLLPQDGEVLFYGRPTHDFVFDLTRRGEAGVEEMGIDRRNEERLLAMKTAGELFDLPLEHALVAKEALP